MAVVMDGGAVEVKPGMTGGKLRLGGTVEVLMIGTGSDTAAPILGVINGGGRVNRTLDTAGGGIVGGGAVVVTTDGGDGGKMELGTAATLSGCAGGDMDLFRLWLAATSGSSSDFARLCVSRGFPAGAPIWRERRSRASSTNG